MSLLPYTISNICTGEGSSIIELWADPYVIYHTIRCLTMESAYGLESSVVCNLQHAILHFNPRASRPQKQVQWYLEYWVKELEKEHEEYEAEMGVKYGQADADEAMDRDCGTEGVCKNQGVEDELS